MEQLDAAWRPIRVHRTIERDGPPVARTLVDCPRHDRLMDLNACVNCASFEGAVVDPTGRASNARCTSSARTSPERPLLARVHEVVRVYATVREDVPADRLAGIFDELGTSGLPVVSATNRLLGVVTKTDLTRERPAAALQAGDLVTPIHFTVREDQTLEEAIALMAWKGVHRVPVASRETGEVLGLLNALDVIRWLADQPTSTPDRLK